MRLIGTSRYSMTAIITSTPCATAMASMKPWSTSWCRQGRPTSRNVTCWRCVSMANKATNWICGAMPTANLPTMAMLPTLPVRRMGHITIWPLARTWFRSVLTLPKPGGTRLMKMATGSQTITGMTCICIIEKPPKVRWPVFRAMAPTWTECSTPPSWLLVMV